MNRMIDWSCEFVYLADGARAPIGGAATGSGSGAAANALRKSAAQSAQVIMVTIIVKV